jgi:hypothetical protein
MVDFVKTQVTSIILVINQYKAFHRIAHQAPGEICVMQKMKRHFADDELAGGVDYFTNNGSAFGIGIN